jgi:mannosyltransferase
LSAVAHPLERLRDRARARIAVVDVVRAAVAVALLIVVSIMLRTSALGARFWIDEGLTIGISSHPFGDIPGLLRQDGSPPLYYLLLHLWTSVFGAGEARTHALSVAFAAATVPVAYFLARRLYDVRVALVTALLFALNPFLTYYAQETRMYALVSLLSLCTAGTFALAFVLRRRAWLPPFVASLTLLVYTHNWGLATAAATLIALLALVRAAAGEERRALLRDGLLAYGAVALLYLPWVPTFVFQATHTAAPWSDRPGLDKIWNTTSSVFGGAAPGMALALCALVGLVALLQRPVLGGATASRERRVTVTLLTILAAGVLLPWLASQPSPAWATRYFAAVLGPLLLVAGVGLARAGWMGVVGILLVVVFWMEPRTDAIDNKSNAHHVATEVRDFLYPGDVVVAAHPEYGPTMHIYMPEQGLRWWNTLGPVQDPTMLDWRNAMDRLRHARPRRTARRLVRSMKPGQHLVLVMPILRTSSWNAPWTRLVRRRALRWEEVLENDTRMLRIFATPDLSERGLPRGVQIVLYRRVAQGVGGVAANPPPTAIAQS